LGSGHRGCGADAIARGSTLGYVQPTGPSPIDIAAAIAEFERELIRERTGEGRKCAMTNCVKFSRKPKLSDYQRQEAIKRRAAGETLASIAKSYAVDISMISRL
jgi:DNA invertase Pin-like site-specific DNA recombinase